MDRTPGPSTTQELTSVKPSGPDDTLKPPASTDTQPFIPLSKRHLLEPGDEGEADVLIERLKLDDPDFVREVTDAFKGTFSTFDVRIIDWRHLEGTKYEFTAEVDGQRRTLVVERQTKPA